MEGVAGNQLGNVGLAFPNALGVQFALSQVNGNNQGAGNDVFSTVTLTQTGDLIFAEPGDSSVDIGQTNTGQNVQYISQMAGTTMVNSPSVFNGNVVIPHQYTFSMNPENSPTLPTATINANINVGGVVSGTGIVALGSLGTPLGTVETYANGISGVANSITASASNVLISASTIKNQGYFSYVEIDQNGSSNIVSYTPGSLGNSAGNGILSQANAISNVASNYFSVTTSNISTVSRMTSVYNSNTYDNYAGFMNLTADGGANLAANPIINIKAQNGVQGKVAITAASGFYGTAAGGVVDIQATGGNNPLVGLGGTVLVQAFSGGYGTFGGLTSRVSVNAANIGLSAGAISALPGLAGSMNIFGQGLVSITTDTAPPTFLQIPQTIYMYGANGIRLATAGLGIQMLSDMYAGTIYPIANGSNPLIIRGRSSPSAGVQLMDVEKINMVSPNGRITAVSSLNFLSLNNPRDISNLSTINGAPYPPTASSDTSNWALYNQVSTLSSITATVGVLSTLITPSISGVGGSLSFGDTVVNKIQNLYVNNYSLLPIADVSSLFAVTIRANNISDTNAGAGPPLLVIDHVSTLNGGPYLPAQLWSQAPAVQDINANGANINNANTIYANTARLDNGLTILNPATTVQFGGTDLKGVSSINGQPIASSSPNLTLSTLAVSSITGIGGAVVSFNGTVVNGIQNLYVNNTIQAPTIASYATDLQIVTASSMTVGPGPGAGGLALINLSSINGAPYTGGGSSWNGQATTDLNMYLFNIINATSIGTVSITANGAITAGGTVTGNYVNSSNSMSAVSFNTAGVGVNANAINIGSAYFNSNAVSVAELSNLYSINGYPYINSGILQNGQLVLVDDGSAAPITVVPFGGRAAGMYYLTSAVRTGGRDFHAQIQFTRPGPPENGYNFGYGGQYWFFNNNGSGGNQIYVLINFVLSSAPGDFYNTTEVPVPAGSALTFYMVPIPTGFGLATNWAKIGCIDYKVIPITPIY